MLVMDEWLIGSLLGLRQGRVTRSVRRKGPSMASNLLVNATLTPRTELGCPTSTFALDAAAEIKYMHAQVWMQPYFFGFQKILLFCIEAGLEVFYEFAKQLSNTILWRDSIYFGAGRATRGRVPESIKLPTRERVSKYISFPDISITMNVRSTSNPFSSMEVLFKSPVRSSPDDPSVK